MSKSVMVFDPQECVEKNCPNEWAACQKDPKCVPALQDCEKKCGSNVNCWTFCLPGKGSQAAINVAKCAQAHGCLSEVPSTALVPVDPQECVEKNCPNEWAACQKDPKCVPALQDCEKKCGSNVNCWTFCLPGKGSQAAINVAKCAQAHGCLSEVPSTALVSVDPQECVEKNCPNEWAACQKDPKCVPALQDCEKKCGSNVNCWTFCLPGKGSQAAINVAKCAQAHGCLSEVPSTALVPVDPQECVEKNCPNEWAACQKDPKCVPALQDCEKKCGSNVNCWTFCLPGKGSQAAINVAKCAQAHGCLSETPTSTPYMNCMAQSC